MKKKLFILSDSPAGTSGLGRICRDLALRIHEHLSDVYDLAVYGYGAQPTHFLPFRQYEMKIENFVPTNLPEVWRDFAGTERGICLSIFNPSWLPWMVDPSHLLDEKLKSFLASDPFEKWIYAPIDGDVRPGRQPRAIAECIASFDRVAVYTHFAKNSVLAALDTEPEIAVLPHGLDQKVFYPRDKAIARDTLVKRVAGIEAGGISDDVVLIGVVATNTPRKDWYLAFETAAELVSRGVNVGLWIHVDKLRANWDIPALISEFGLDGRVIASNRSLSDEDMAWAYSACDVAWAIASGGGWEMPISESLGCGVPVVHGNYAGGAEIMPMNGLVEPAGFRGDSFFALRRPIFRASDWADKTTQFVPSCQRSSLIAPKYYWDNAWADQWEPWLREGANQ